MPPTGGGKKRQRHGVLYCNGGDCEDSQLLASKLLALGYRNVFDYRGGVGDWKRNGGRVEGDVRATQPATQGAER